MLQCWTYKVILGYSFEGVIFFFQVLRFVVLNQKISIHSPFCSNDALSKNEKLRFRRFVIWLFSS